MAGGKLRQRDPSKRVRSVLAVSESHRVAAQARTELEGAGRAEEVIKRHRNLVELFMRTSKASSFHSKRKTFPFPLGTAMIS